MSHNSGGPPPGRRRDQSRQQPPANQTQALNAYSQPYLPNPTQAINACSPSNLPQSTQAMSAYSQTNSTPLPQASSAFMQNTPSSGNPAGLPSRPPRGRPAGRKCPSHAVFRERVANHPNYEYLRDQSPGLSVDQVIDKVANSAYNQPQAFNAFRSEYPPPSEALLASFKHSSSLGQATHVSHSNSPLPQAQCISASLPRSPLYPPKASNASFQNSSFPPKPTSRRDIEPSSQPIYPLPATSEGFDSFSQKPSLIGPANVSSEPLQSASASRKPLASDTAIQGRPARDFEVMKNGIGERLTEHRKQSLTAMDEISRLTKELDREKKAHELVLTEADDLNYQIRLFKRYISEDALDLVLYCYSSRVEPPPYLNSGSVEGKGSVEDADTADEGTDEQTEDETDDEDDGTAQIQSALKQWPRPIVAGNLDANLGSLPVPPTKTFRARPPLAPQMPQQHEEEPGRRLQVSSPSHLVNVSRHPETSVSIATQQNQQVPDDYLQYSTPLAPGAQQPQPDGTNSSRQTRANNAGFTPCALPQTKPQKRPYKRPARVLDNVPRSSKKRCTTRTGDDLHPNTYTIPVSDLSRGTLSAVGLLLQPLLEEQFAEWNRGFLKRWRDEDTTGPKQCLTMRSRKIGTTRLQEGTACTSCEEKGKLCVSIIEEGVLTVRPLRDEVRKGGPGERDFWVISG